MNSESGGTTSASGASLVKPGPYIVSGEMRGRMGKKRCSGWGGEMPANANAKRIGGFGGNVQNMFFYF